MSAAEKTVSALIESQLPDFVNGDHPQFKRFLELYYQWMEQNSANGISNTAGNTIYHAMEIENYRDIDQTPPEFVKYFKDEILPFFPEGTSLSTEKILKSAREFYSKKGSDESLRWLFKALFNEDIEINYPKEQIFIASDGKWIQPRAFRITVTDQNRSIDPNLFERRQVVGVESGATCVIERASRSIDPTNGREVLEIYVSNIKKYFNNGEFIEIAYVDENGSDQVFRERIIGTLSNIRVDSNIRTDPAQRRRGLYYNVGDPIVITGGLGISAEANDAAAIVNEISQGSIEAVTMGFRGYGYRTYSNSEVVVLRSIGDDPNANSSTDLRINAINTTACTSNSQRNFLEKITYDKAVINILEDTVISTANYVPFTTKTRNVVLNVTEDDADDFFLNYALVYANGNNYTDALFTAKIATPNGQTAISGTVSYYGNSAITGTITTYGNTSITGTVNVAVLSYKVIGNNTTFTSDFAAYDYIRIIDQTRQVLSVDSDTELTIDTPFSYTRNDLTAKKANTNILGSGTTFTSSLAVNDVLVVNNETAIITNIANNTSLTINYPFSFSDSGYTAYKNNFSTPLSIVGNGTNFNILTAGQKLRVGNEDREIANIANDLFLNVTTTFTSTFSAQTAYRIGKFGAKGGFGTEQTGDIILYDIANTGSLSVILNGAQLNVLPITDDISVTATTTPDKSFLINSITTYLLPSNVNSTIAQCLDLETVNTGGIDVISVLNGGGGFRSSPDLLIRSFYDTQLSEQYNYNSEYDVKANTRQLFKDLGLIAHVYIDNGGSGYSNNDIIKFDGRGYSGGGYVSDVDSNGAIKSVVLFDRGEGHLVRPNVIVERASPTYTTLTGSANIVAGNATVIGVNTQFTTDFGLGSTIRINNELRKVATVINNTILRVNTAFFTSGNGNTVFHQDGIDASLTAYLYGDGEDYTIDTSAIGRVRDIRLLYRGYDYVSVPNVSLKVVDAIVNPIATETPFTETEYIYQGSSLETATFKANIKYFNNTTGLLRLYNYSGRINRTIDLKTGNGIFCNINTSMNVSAPEQYDAGVIAIGLPNPMYYGNGRARAKALFANGLIEFDGFYLNSDGFPSADKVFQDSEIYHNFSYIVQSEKNLVDFEVPIKNIVHPAGMSLISKTVLKQEEDQQYVAYPNVSIIMPGNGTEAVTVTNSYSNVVIGFSTFFNPPVGNIMYSNTRVNVGDLFIIEDGFRNPISRIVSAVNSNTELEVEGNFIYTGEGRLNSNVQYENITGNVLLNPPVTGTVNVNPPITGTINLNPLITGTVNVEISNIILTYNTITGTASIATGTNTVTGTFHTYANGTASVTGSANTVTGSGTTFVLDLEVGDIIRVNNEIRKIENVISNTSLNVNSNFAQTATSQTLFFGNTKFLNEFVEGSTIKINNEVREVVLVIDNNTLTVNTNFATTGSAKQIYKNDGYYTGNTDIELRGNNTTFLSNIAANDIIVVNNQVRKVINVVNNTFLLVNDRFYISGTDQSCYVSSNIVYGNGTTFVLNVAANDIIVVDNVIKQVVNVTSNTQLIVNSIFSNSSSDLIVYKRSNTVYGTGTNFDPQINVGDIITVNNEIREVTNVVSDTELTVNNVFTNYSTGELVYKQNSQVLGTATTFTADLIVGDTIKVNNQVRRVTSISTANVLTVNAGFDYYGTGNDIAKISNTIVTLSANDVITGNNVLVSDNVSFNIFPSNLMVAQTGTVQIFTSNGMVIGTGTLFTTELLANDTIMIGNQVRKIVNIANNTILNVNLGFSAADTGELLYKRAAAINAQVLSISGNTLSLNVALNANLSNLVYVVNPNFRQIALVGGTVNTSGNLVVANTSNANTPTSFVGTIYIDNEIIIDGQTKTVVNVNASTITVNTNWTSPGSNKYLTVYENHTFNVVTLTAY